MKRAKLKGNLEDGFGAKTMIFEWSIKLCLSVLCICFTVFSCSVDTEPDLPNISICPLYSPYSMPSLASKLAAFDSIDQRKTGLYVFESGEEAIIGRAWLSQNASKTIDIQYFIFSEDNIGIIACDYMLQAACRGVKIRLIVDDLMLNVHPEYVLALAEHENIEIKIYNPNLNIGKNLGEKLINVATEFREINQRMHHKTFIVDGEVTITGGRNIADEYFDYDHEYNFRDRDVILIRGISGEIQKRFNEFWKSDLSVDIESIVEYPKPDYKYNAVHHWVREYASDSLNFWPQIRAVIPTSFDRLLNSEQFYWVDSVSYVSDIPGKNAGDDGLKGGSNTTSALFNLVKNAQQSIYIQSPYLITTDLGNDLFNDAIKRGVEIHILTNSLASTDNAEAFSGYQRSRKDLLDIGVHIYEYKPDAAIRKNLMKSELQKRLDFVPTFGLHAKSMVIDDSIAIIGTFNLDPRSAHLNTECLTIIHSKSVASDMLRIMKEEQESQNAWTTTKDFNPDGEASMGKRIKAFTRRIVPKSIL